MVFRFVVLHHTGLKTGKRGDHWDWLLELPTPSMAKKTSKDSSGCDLDSWSNNPIIASGLSQQGSEQTLIAFATESPLLSRTQGAGFLLDAWEGVRFWRLPMHRSAYLSYEGPISRGRGHVRRVGNGVLRWLEIGPLELQFEILNAEFEGVSSHIATPVPYFLSHTQLGGASSNPWSDPEPDDAPHWALRRQKSQL
ncbi:MAG: hypothetical protein FJ308_11350 [Planctomycetes bacterium]|nr:hypothetical protein [Planctomycetota bacterium]